MIGRCTSRNGPTPMNQISVATISAIAALVAMVLTQGCQPPRISPTGRRCCSDEQIGRADAEHHERMAVEPIAAAGPSASAPDIRARSACRCRRCRAGRDCRRWRDASAWVRRQKS